jgi:hypothetical protein
MDTHFSWQKLEPHSHSEDFSTGIRATVHDPLWMLTRQWQLGEFEGEDSASPIYVKVENRQDEISAVAQNNGSIPIEDTKWFEYDGSIPLEAFVERTKLEVTTKAGAADGRMKSQLDLQMQVRLGLQFQREMDTLLKDLLVDSAELRRFKRFLAQDPDLRFDLDDGLDEYEAEITRKFISIVKGRVVNIYRATNLDTPAILMSKTLQYFASNPNPVPDLPGQVGKALEIALGNLKNWWYGYRISANTMNEEEPFFERPPENFSLWNPSHLEYDFKVQITPKGTSPPEKLILDASGYKEDHLEWYSFAVSESGSTVGFELPLEPKPDPLPPNPIATSLRFAGMPEKRWWNFEDGHVDFGSINPKKNNIATILLMEFALVYSPDWYIIPHQMRVGTINKIENLAVVDCFGDETLIEPAGHTKSEFAMTESDKSWDSWGMFTLSEKYKDRDRQHYTPYFLLPPTIDYVLTGAPLEEVKMLRDETANLVWAIERKYRTFYGEPVSGYDHSFFLQRKTQEVLPADRTEEESEKPLKYTFMTSVPRNWIPFVPVHATKETTSSSLDSLQKHIKLQRASMINLVDGTRIRPNSRLLNEVQPHYYVDEAEVPRNGIVASENCQRTIWHTGEIFLWIGRKKYYGAGEGSSGLQFDSISLENKL